MSCYVVASLVASGKAFRLSWGTQNTFYNDTCMRRKKCHEHES